MAVGRALETKDIERAKALAGDLDESPAALLVTARLAETVGDYETAVRVYHRMSDQAPGFEAIRVEALANALALAGRNEEAFGQLQVLLSVGKKTDRETYRLLMKQGELAAKFDQEKARDIYKTALSVADDAKQKEAASLAHGEVLLRLGEKKASAEILENLAREAHSGEVMTDALSLLEEKRLVPKWTGEIHLERARRLMTYRAFDAATAAITAAWPTANREEAAWVKANILFKRRGHYKEAAEALDAIVKGGGVHADEARFLAARALSRQDKDGEAIKAYRAFSVKTNRPGRGHYARFLAARLEFYLGRHQQALHAFELLVGNGQKRKIGKLGDAGDRRDAHFLAGVSAVLLNRPARAIPHLEAASDGTTHSEVLKRNAYWSAVAHAMLASKGAENHFWEICADDPTDWYARMSAMRLSKMQKDLGACQIPRYDVAEADAGVPETPAVVDSAQVPNIPALTEISPLVGLFAAAGLFKDAARILRSVEKDNIIKLPARTWIQHYVSLDAPQHAIRRAAREFEWPPTPENIEVGRAAYPVPYATVIREVESKKKLPPDLLPAIARKESLFDPHAVSWVGAMGLMQMMPRTYETNRKRAGLDRLKKGQLPGPIDSIKAAGEEFAHLFETFDNSLPLAIMAYNGGVGAVKRWVSRSGDLPLDVFVEKVGFTQTRNYVRRVTQNLVRYRALYGNPIPELPEMIYR